ncbi:hypothetical protein SASPL_137150 [Salvia splendens]|uniref:Solute carrier family 15 (Peptide/histidine transporter), member 3/4 n=1 Tax=Salvia splendens TaxID=180675 RepID=A0A8X8WT70_SALSN|nr:hypothetical protein SASPL_137150 [Salvia splendens]
MKEEGTDSTLVTNGCVDYKGRIASKQTTGGWKASPFIIVNEVAERLAFFAVAVNMVGYLVREMHQPFPDAATHVTDWIGAAYVLTLFGAFLPDAYLGRFNHHLLRHLCTDQFDQSDPNEAQKKYAFFNWFFFAINMGALLGITLMVYIQDEFDWAWGFGVPTAAMITSMVIFAAGFMRRRVQILRSNPPSASTIALAISFTQLSTYFIIQAGTTDRKLGSISIPASSRPVSAVLNALLAVPLYEKLAVPYLHCKTGHPRGLTSLQRIGAGLFVSILAMASAALFEFFYDEAMDGTRSISSAMLLSEIGSWLSTAIVKAIEGATGGAEEGWLRNDLNKSRLDVRDESAAVELAAETRSSGGDGKAEFRSVVI